MTFAQVLAQASSAGRIEIERAPLDGRARWANLSSETVAPVVQWLDQHAPFQDVAGQLLIRSNGTEVVQSSSAAVYLTERAIEFGPEAVAASFDRVMAGEVVTHALVVVVRGVSAASAVDLTAGVTVEPISSLFSVSERARAYAAVADLRLNGVPTAIVLRAQAKPTYTAAPVGSLPPALLHAVPFPSIQPALDALALVAGAGVVPDVSYAVVEEAGWPTMIAGSIGGYIVQRVVDLTPVQGLTLGDVSELLKRHGQDDALNRALRKLRDALGRTNDAERALDLGACLEILLMHGEKADNNEIGYKLRMRAVWLLGRDPADRKRVHDLVRSAYSARSKVAHEGVLPTPTTIDAHAHRASELRDTEELCRELIMHVLNRGWPNWTTTVLQG